MGNVKTAISLDEAAVLSGMRLRQRKLLELLWCLSCASRMENEDGAFSAEKNEEGVTL